MNWIKLKKKKKNMMIKKKKIRKTLKFTIDMENYKKLGQKMVFKH